MNITPTLQYQLGRQQQEEWLRQAEKDRIASKLPNQRKFFRWNRK